MIHSRPWNSWENDIFGLSPGTTVVTFAKFSSRSLSVSLRGYGENPQTGFRSHSSDPVRHLNLNSIPLRLFGMTSHDPVDREIGDAGEERSPVIGFRARRHSVLTTATASISTSSPGITSWGERTVALAGSRPRKAALRASL